MTNTKTMQSDILKYVAGFGLQYGTILKLTTWLFSNCATIKIYWGL